MEKFEKQHIDRMKKYLPILRKAAGWKAEDLGELIGVTRQTITSLEKNEDYKMTKTQYIALRAVFYREAQRTENKHLEYLIDLLILKDDFTEEETKEINAAVDKVNEQTGRSVNSAAVLAGMSAMLGMFGYALGGLPAAASLALQGTKIASDKTKGSKKQ